MHSIFKKSYDSWSELESAIESLPTSGEKGEVFEEFAIEYFKARSTYYQISDIWRTSDIPSGILAGLEIESSDAGVDGLIRHINGTFSAYQVKFRTGRQKPKYSELSKFWAEARKCDFQYTFANCSELTRLSSKNPKHLQILGLDLDGLDVNFFRNLTLIANEDSTKPERFKADGFQERMIADVLKGFATADRGKLIAACGTGKTLTALWISEELGAKKILFIAPSIALIKQTLAAWSEQAAGPFQFVCICSDSTVADDVDDQSDLRSGDLGVPVTTDPIEISRALNSFGDGVSVVFSTYQSLAALREAVQETKYAFDLAFFDEAHRTAGTNDSDNFSLALFNRNIPISKRLFMTATERLIKPTILKKAKQLNRVLFSMNDKRIYGEVFHRFTFGEAIEQRVISDYRIVVAGVRSSEVFNWIKENKLLVDLNANSEELQTSASNLFKQTLLLKVMDKYPVEKIITFHNSIKLAKDFISGPPNNGNSLIKILKIMEPEVNSSNYYLGHVNGSLSASKRHSVLMEFKESKYGVVSNARCLTEGVDVPIIDSIYFVDPRNSLIDIVQACGRALRKPRNGEPKLAYFIIPILIPDGDPREALNKLDYDMVHMLIQSLRDQDNRLEQWVERLNLSLVKKSSEPKPPSSGGSGWPGIEVFLPTEFDIEEFERHLYVQIAEVNRNPDGVAEIVEGSSGSRRSSVKRVFRTIGDYSWSSYNSSLILPVMGKFRSLNSIVDRHEISKINHNAESHSNKLGVIELNGKNSYQLTELGKVLKKSPKKFPYIFKEQMLKYHEVRDDVVVFPYREILKLLCEFRSISYFEFCFAIYGVTEYGSDFHTTLSSRFEYVRDSYENLDMASNKNRVRILEDLNSKLKTGFSYEDVWTSSTTVANQWGYWRNHLSLLDPAIQVRDVGKSIAVSPEYLADVQGIIAKTHSIEEIEDLKSLSEVYKTNQIAVEIFNIN